MTAYMGVEVQVRLADAETEATSWSIADMDRVANELGRERFMVSL